MYIFYCEPVTRSIFGGLLPRGRIALIGANQTKPNPTLSIRAALKSPSLSINSRVFIHKSEEKNNENVWLNVKDSQTKIIV